MTDDTHDLVARHISDPDGDVFALTGLPEVVKGALFARYSRSPHSLKRLLVDEFADGLDGTDNDRAAALMERVIGQYGDDSVAQLAGVHVAMENVSNLLTKRIEWGRLAAYLEQSTRYIAYDDKPNGRYRYHRDADIMAGPHAGAYVATLDSIFDTYAELVPQVLSWVRNRWPKDDDTSPFVYNNATKAKALDLLRGLLPAATTSNVGMFASGQAYENLLLRLRSDDLAESHAVAAGLLTELRKVIPSFLTRIDRPDRGVVWANYLADTRNATRDLAGRYLDGAAPPAAPVTLTDWSPRDPADAEVALVTAILYPHANMAEGDLQQEVAAWPAGRRSEVIAAYVGDRTNRRHKPGRAFERIWYRFDVLGDYGGFRDLQRHRMLTIEWQNLTPDHGYDIPDELHEAGVADRYQAALAASADLHGRLIDDHPVQAQYAVCFAYRVRYAMQLNARAAMQMLELRSAPQGHPAYRRIVQQMHHQIRDVAGHQAIADAMRFVDHGDGELERLEAERAAEARRNRLAAS